MIGVLLVSAMLSAPARAAIQEVAVSLPGEEVGVAYAAQVLGEECRVTARLGVKAAEKRPGIRAGLRGDPLVADVKLSGVEKLSPQGFGWVSSEGGLALVAAAPTGLMYGLFEVADRLHNREPLEPRKLSEPAVGLRGDYIDLPFYLGCDLYDGRWRWHERI